MSRVEKIEREIIQLPPDDFARLVTRIREVEQQRWDEQMDHDATSGKLDFLIAEAKAE